MAQPDSSMMTRAGRAAGRAVVGVLAGLVVTTLGLAVASQNFRLVTFREPASGDPRFWAFVAIGGAATDGLAVARGGAFFPDRLGSIVRGACLGAACGVLGGAPIGNALGVPKGGVFLGIFLGGPVGALLGGVLGFENERVARRRRSGV